MASITAWAKKVWKDRKTEYPTRRTLTKTNGSQEIVTVTRNEGSVSQEGDAFSAENMNNLEERIDAGFTELTSNLNAPFRTATKSYMITPSAAKSVINLSYDLSDIILDGYSASDIIITSVNYTGSHLYQQVTVTDANGKLSGTARIMAETTAEFSLRFTVLLYKKSAFINI